MEKCTNMAKHDTAPESGDRPGSPVCSVQGKSGGRDDPEVLAGPRQGHRREAQSATPVSPGGPRNPPSAHLSGQQRDEDGCQGCRPAPRRQQLCCLSASRSGRGSGPHSETGRHRLLPERSWNLNSLPADPLTGLSPEPPSVTDKSCGGTWGFEATGRGDCGGVPHYPRPGSPGCTGTDSHRASWRSTKKCTGWSATARSPSNLC